jgi:hypothetical protein
MPAALLLPPRVRQHGRLAINTHCARTGMEAGLKRLLGLKLLQPPTFAEARHEFDMTLGTAKALAKSLVPVHGKAVTNIALRGSNDRPLEEYYKWQFIYALTHSGLFPKDYLGAEVRFPKGTSELKIDLAIFDDPDWNDHYVSYWEHRRPHDLQWLGEHLLAVAEFKRNDNEIEQVFTRQIKPAMREKEPSDAYALGVYYDHGRLYLFQRRNGKFLRYDEPKNQKGEASTVGDLSLQIPDPTHSSRRCNNCGILFTSHRPLIGSAAGSAIWQLSLPSRSLRFKMRYRTF